MVSIAVFVKLLQYHCFFQKLFVVCTKTSCTHHFVFVSIVRICGGPLGNHGEADITGHKALRNTTCSMLI